MIIDDEYTTCRKCGSTDVGYSERPVGYESEDGFVDCGWSETYDCKKCGYTRIIEFGNDLS